MVDRRWQRSSFKGASEGRLKTERGESGVSICPTRDGGTQNQKNVKGQVIREKCRMRYAASVPRPSKEAARS